MLIDWFTIVAQVINFLILVFLLKRFLYGPILRAIDAREERIAAELADADARMAEAREQHDEFLSKNEELDRQRATILDEARDEAKAEHRRLLDEARQEAMALRAKQQQALRADASNLNDAIGRRAQQEVLAIARQALVELAATSLEERMTEVFTRRLRELDDEAKAGLAEAIGTASAPAIVRSAFDLPDAQRVAIREAVDETFKPGVELEFATEPELISGIELTVNGRKVAWSIADHLASLGQGVAEILEAQDARETGNPESAEQRR